MAVRSFRCSVAVVVFVDDDDVVADDAEDMNCVAWNHFKRGGFYIV